MKMTALSVALLLVLCVWRGSLAVQVKVGDRSFHLEDVKQLKELMDVDDHMNPHLASTSIAVVCANPALPEVFLPVCQEKGTAAVFSTLVKSITPLDPCEICAYPSCYGCLN